MKKLNRTGTSQEMTMEMKRLFKEIPVAILYSKKV